MIQRASDRTLIASSGQDQVSRCQNVGHHGGRTVDSPLAKVPQAVLPWMSLFWLFGKRRATVQRQPTPHAYHPTKGNPTAQLFRAHPTAHRRIDGKVKRGGAEGAEGRCGPTSCQRNIDRVLVSATVNANVGDDVVGG